MLAILHEKIKTIEKTNGIPNVTVQCKNNCYTSQEDVESDVKPYLYAN